MFCVSLLQTYYIVRWCCSSHTCTVPLVLGGRRAFYWVIPWMLKCLTEILKCKKQTNKQNQNWNKMPFSFFAYSPSSLPRKEKCKNKTKTKKSCKEKNWFCCDIQYAAVHVHVISKLWSFLTIVNARTPVCISKKRGLRLKKWKRNTCTCSSWYGSQNRRFLKIKNYWGFMEKLTRKKNPPCFSHTGCLFLAEAADDMIFVF